MTEPGLLGSERSSASEAPCGLRHGTAALGQTLKLLENSNDKTTPLQRSRHRLPERVCWWTLALR